MTPHNLVFTTTIVKSETSGNLLSFLVGRFPYHSINEWQEQIAAGRVILNGETVLADHLLSPGDILSYHPEQFKEPDVSTDIEMIELSCPDFLITGKPAGTPVTRTGLIITNTFINILRRNFINPDIHLMHRLDRETSGIVLCALSREVCRRHQQNLANIMVGKYYLAIVRGKMKVRELMVDLPLGNAPDSAIRSKVTVTPTGKRARSIIHTVASSAENSLVLVRLLSGRKHQIRCHLAHLGHPVIGDKIYDHNGRYYLKRLAGDLSKKDFEILGAVNHTLHAWAADIELPDQGRKRYFSQCFSDDFIRYAEVFPEWQERTKGELKKLIRP